MDYKVLKAKILMAFKGLQIPVQFLNKMLRRKQQEKESIDSYVYKKLALCQKVNKNMTEMDTIGHIINGFIQKQKSTYKENNHSEKDDKAC